LIVGSSLLPVVSILLTANRRIKGDRVEQAGENKASRSLSPI
jgi:hypothetical protein